MSRRIVQLTDLHLLPRAEDRLRGVPTVRVVSDVIEHLQRQVPDADALVISGDLAQDEAHLTYRRLAKMLGSWTSRMHIIPGNHDNRLELGAVFASRITLEDERIVFTEQLDAWRLIGIDSQEPGKVAGRVGAKQLRWLDGQLRDHATSPTIVFVHHPPISVETSWFDEIGLRDAKDLRRVIERHTHVKLLCCGHVHFEFEGRIGSARVVTTPAASFQFASRTPSQQYDLLPPGYRVIELDGAEFRTKVVRLAKLDYPPKLKD